MVRHSSMDSSKFAAAAGVLAKSLQPGISYGSTTAQEEELDTVAFREPTTSVMMVISTSL